MRRFETFGPYSLNRTLGVVSELSLEAMWREVDAANPGLKNAYGVYIIASQRGSASLLPWYVGKTEGQFRRRFAGHLRDGYVFSKIDEQFPRGKLKVLLLARTSDSEKRTGFRVARKKNSTPLQSITRLETMLIGICRVRNKSLINTRDKMWHENLYVPGYLNDDPKGRTAAALQFAAMLESK